MVSRVSRSLGFEVFGFILIEVSEVCGFRLSRFKNFKVSSRNQGFRVSKFLRLKIPGFLNFKKSSLSRI
jgi:hypothetical protein